MKFYLAPLEGITNYIVRNAFYHNFDGIDRYFTPFIPAAKKLSNKYKRDLLPENNQGIELIPQLISNRSDEILEMGHLIKETYGYDTFNLNLGCPSGTVVSKNRGAGALLDVEALDQMLYTVYEQADFKMSVKTRLGMHSLDEWPAIEAVYQKYPMEELIIHPRLRDEMYKGQPHRDIFYETVDAFNENSVQTSICYNGDIVDLSSYEEVVSRCKDTNVNSVMIGRGALRNPGLIEVLSGAYKTGDIDEADYRRRIRAWHDEILDGYCQMFSGEKDATLHLKEIWFYLGDYFEGCDKELKALKKSKTTEEYKLHAYNILG